MGRFRDMDKHLDTDTTQWYWPQNSCLLLLGISAAQLWVSIWNNTEAAVRYWANMLLPQRMDTSATQAYSTVPWSLPLCRDGAGAWGHRRIHGALGSRTCPHQVCTPGRRPTSNSSFRNSRGHHKWEHSNPPLVAFFKKGNLKVHLARGTGRRSKSCMPQLLLKPPLQVFLCLFCSETPLLHLALSNSALISLYLFHNGLNN